MPPKSTDMLPPDAPAPASPPTLTFWPINGTYEDELRTEVGDVIVYGTGCINCHLDRVRAFNHQHLLRRNEQLKPAEDARFAQIKLKKRNITPVIHRSAKSFGKEIDEILLDIIAVCHSSALAQKHCPTNFFAHTFTPPLLQRDQNRYQSLTVCQRTQRLSNHRPKSLEWIICFHGMTRCMRRSQQITNLNV